MKQRMSRDDRREKLLEIMKAKYALARTKEEFTAELIADDAEVSAVWVYKLIGKEFKRLRVRLKGQRRPPQSTEHKLRCEIAKLRQTVDEGQVKYKADIEGDYSEAVRIIEALSEEVQIRDDRIKVLTRRLQAYEIVVDLSPVDEEVNEEDLISEGESEVVTSSGSNRVINSDEKISH